MSLKHRRVAFTIRVLLLAIILPVAACRKSETPEKPSISVFASPDDASNARLTRNELISVPPKGAVRL